MEIKEKFISIVSKWKKVNKLYLLISYNKNITLKDFKALSEDELNIMCAEFLTRNLHHDDVNKIMTIK